MEKNELLGLLADYLEEAHWDEIEAEHNGDQDCSYCDAIKEAREMIANPKPINGDELAMLLLKFINNMAVDDDEFVRGLTESHRTLQQSIMRIFIKFVAAMSVKEEGFYDLRNEASVKLAREIMKLNTGLPFI